MSEDRDILNRLLFTECRCKKKAPYLFIARLDPNGNPVWNPDGTLRPIPPSNLPDLTYIPDIRRVAICETLQCSFLSHWAGAEDGLSIRDRIMEWEAQYHAAQHQTNTRNIQRPHFSNIAVAGVGHSIGDTLINLNFGVLQDYSMPSHILFNPSFTTLVDNSTELSYQKRWELLMRWTLLRWLFGIG
ncbi:hypothetical protein F5Y03DRAFT_226867 [Xylaria venustula]|nr:hypothetical protein F5Y03DRAFT_226867 [Xylaria venustula]